MARVIIPGFRKIEVSGGGSGGTTNYADLTNKPSINNIPLVGNLSTVNLKLTDATLTEAGVPAEAKTVGDSIKDIEEQISSIQATLSDIKGELIANSLRVKAKSTTVTQPIPTKYQFIRILYYDGNNAYRMSAELPIFNVNIPFLSQSGLNAVKMTVNEDRTLTFNNESTIDFVITYLYAVNLA